MSDRWWIRWVLVIGLFLVAQVAAQPAEDASVEDSMIELNFGESVELKILIDYVAKRLNVNVLYDEQVGNKMVTIRAPQRVPRSSLMGLLESVLRMKGLVLVDADQPGWKRVVPVGEMGSFARADSEKRTGASAITQVFRLTHLDGKQAEQMIQPLLTRPGGNGIGIPRQPILIVTDFASNLPRIEQVLDLIDQPRGGVVTKAYTVRHAELSRLSGLVQELVAARYRAEWGGQEGASQPYLAPVQHANQIVVVGVTGQVDDTITLLGELDVPEQLTTRAYHFQYTTPTQVNNLVQGLLDPGIRQGRYRYVIDEDLGLLAVATTDTVHMQIQQLARDLDIAPLESQNPVRIYKLLNTEAVDVLTTIRALEGKGGFADYLSLEEGGPGETVAATDTDQAEKNNPEGTAAIEQNVAASAVNGLVLPAGIGDVRVAVDEHTNSILVIAPPAEQRVYERLIQLLDQRRPQVLIEAIIVTLDTSNGYSFGVEIGGSGSAGDVDGRFITFSSFGLSSVNAATGSLALTPGLGFNGTLLSSDIADVVLRALRTNGRASVVSAPRILVNDNTPGTLSSVAAEPYAAIVDSSNNTSTTTLGGNATAGTIITVTPRISVDDYLQLEYEIELSNFTGDRTASLPPPSQQNTITSDVTIPDGHTIVVGGINRLDTSNTISAVPFLGEIPMIEHLFRSVENSRREQTLFVFIRPVILRDDRFADLKYLSGRDRELAGLDKAYPDSEPLVVY